MAASRSLLAAINGIKFFLLPVFFKASSFFGTYSLQMTVSSIPPNVHRSNFFHVCPEPVLLYNTALLFVKSFATR